MRAQIADGPLLRTPAFRWFFTGRLVSLLGSSMAPVALSFAVLEASNSAGDMGAVLAANTIPLIVFTLAGGVVGDRFSRRLVLLVSNLGAGLSQAVVAFLLVAGPYHLWTLILLEAVNGTLTAFTTPALRGIVPDLVGPSRLQKANSLLGSVRNATKILGPAAAGTMVATAGGGWAIAIDAATYFFAAACLARLSLDTPPPSGRRSPLADLRDGWAEFRSRTWVWLTVACFGFVNFLQVGIWRVLGPLIARDTIGETAWGAVLGANAAGVLVMSVAMYRIVLRSLLPIGQLCVVALAFPLIALGLHANFPWLAGVAFVAGLGSGVYGIAWETSLQEHVPREMLSRISSYDNLGSFVAIPAGQLAAAPFAAAFGAPHVALAGGIVCVVLLLVPLTTKSVRGLRHG
ncbi:MFS transporter [Amycolatopsis sp. NPDC059027]|uniref:MFS transporter n=1 Tax=unclassified Amycolatopsis TaxID=2618356 RepID=UPI0036713CA5